MKNLMKNVFFALLLFSLASCVTSGKKIDNYSNPQKALLVIDMQIDYVDEKGKFPIEIDQINNLIETVNMIIDDFQKNNYVIIYVRNNFRKNDIRNIFRNYAAIEGTSGAEIHPGINIASENIFDKYSPSALSNNDLKNFLMQNQINELFLCGVMADVNECVGQTALDALNNGYMVNYIGNAVGSSSIKNIERAIDKLRKRGIKIIEYGVSTH
jgi:nicotinamidase/pyrazinamidase